MTRSILRSSTALAVSLAMVAPGPLRALEVAPEAGDARNLAGTCDAALASALAVDAAEARDGLIRSCQDGRVLAEGEAQLLLAQLAPEAPAEGEAGEAEAPVEEPSEEAPAEAAPAGEGAAEDAGAQGEPLLLDEAPQAEVEEGAAAEEPEAAPAEPQEADAPADGGEAEVLGEETEGEGLEGPEAVIEIDPAEGEVPSDDGIVVEQAPQAEVEEGAATADGGGEEADAEGERTPAAEAAPAEEDAPAGESAPAAEEAPAEEEAPADDAADAAPEEGAPVAEEGEARAADAEAPEEAPADEAAEDGAAADPEEADAAALEEALEEAAEAEEDAPEEPGAEAEEEPAPAGPEDGAAAEAEAEEPAAEPEAVAEEAPAPEEAPAGGAAEADEDAPEAAADASAEEVPQEEAPQEEAPAEEAEAPQQDSEESAARANEAPAAAAASAEAEPAEEMEAETLTEEDTRSSDEAFAEDEDEGGLSRFEQALLLGLGAATVGAVLNNGGRVVESTGDRVVIDQGGELQVLKNDDELLRRPGSTVSQRSYDDGSTLTVVEREDGTRVTTIRAASGQVLRRTRTLPDGTEVLLFDDTQPVEPVDVAQLRDYGTPDLRAGEVDDLRAALAGAQAPGVDRAFSLQQIRQIRAVRELMPQIDVQAIEFDTGSAAIRPTEAEALRDIGEAMAALVETNPDEVFLVEGHTDAVGSAASNLALSDRRAESVALALTEYFGVPPENMVAQGYGESNLKVQTADAARENRRATVRRITPLLQGASLE